MIFSKNKKEISFGTADVYNKQTKNTKRYSVDRRNMLTDERSKLKEGMMSKKMSNYG
jgi:hypothetical protein